MNRDRLERPRVGRMTEPRFGWLFISLAGAALAASGFAWGKRSSPPAGPSGVVVERESHEGRGLGAATPRNAAASTLQAMVPANPGIAAELLPGDDEQDLDSPGVSEVGAELEPDDEEHLAEEARIQHFDALSRRIDGEVVDGAWRHETEEPLKRLMVQHLGPKVGVAEATCASTHCRVKLTHPEWSRIPPGWTFAFDLARASLEVTEAQYDNRDEGVTTLYFKRGPAPGRGNP